MSIKTNYPTQKELQECFELRVDFRNGHETLWRKGHIGEDGHVYKDKKVECVANNAGYCQVRFKGRNVKYHTIIWILSFGDIPEGLVILHMNSRSKLCNQSHELRLGTQLENNRETQAHLDGKLLGCIFSDYAKKWMSFITINGKLINLGYYATKEESNGVYLIADKMREEGFSIRFIQKMLRIRTKEECSSKYKGVCWNKYSSKWQASITIEKKNIHLGYFNTEQEASAVHEKANLLIEQYVNPEQFRRILTEV